MKKFEYTVWTSFNFNDAGINNELNRLGKEGWELIIVKKYEGCQTFYLKREIA